MGLKRKVLTVGIVLTALNANSIKRPEEEFVTAYLRSMVLQNIRAAIIVAENVNQQTIVIDWKGCRVELKGILKNNSQVESDVTVNLSTKDRTITVDALSIKELDNKLNDIANSC